jgi:hypothetical protein
MHLHLVFHLGTLAEKREGRDVALEPNPKTVFGGSIPKIEEQVKDWRLLAK